MPCTYTPSPQEIEDERKNVEMAFKLACKAMSIVCQQHDDKVFKSIFSKEEIVWFEQHLSEDIKREKNELKRKEDEIKNTEQEIKNLAVKLNKLKKGK